MRTKYFPWICGVALVGLMASLPALCRGQDPPQEEEAAAEAEDSSPAKAPVAVSPFAGAGPNQRRPIDMTMDNLDIYPVLDNILGRILQLNYVVDPAIKGTISLRIRGDYTRHELLEILNSVLQMHGLAITRGDYDLYKVVRKPGSAKTGSEVMVGTGRTPHPGDVVRVFQLKYLSAAHVVASLRNFVSPGAVIVAEPSVNAIFLVDSADIEAKVSRILDLMDTDFFRDIRWRLFPLEFTDVDDLSRDLERIFQTKGLYARPGLDAGGFEIIPLKTINALLVVTRWEELLGIVDHWVEELDQAQSEKGTQVYVYFVQNGQSKDIADLLKQVYGEKTSKTKGTQKTVLVQRETPEQLRPVESAGELVGEVEIIADEVNNAILIKAKPKDYATIMSVLEQIDVVPRQVLIDVLILEVTLTDNLEYGVEWFFKTNDVFGKYTGNVILDGGTSTSAGVGLGSGLAGFSYSLFNTDALRGLLTALADRTDVNILSSPNILAVDNQESSIESGDEVPTLTSTQTSDGGVTTQSIQYRQTGIVLKVKPTINDGGLVRMEVTQEVSQVTGETTGGIESPRFSTRKATTNLVAHDSHTVVIGGLMQTQKTAVRSGIPVLKDMPVLGRLFGKTSNKTVKTELLFAITPHVIKSREEAEELTVEFAERLKSLKDMLGHQGIFWEKSQEGTGQSESDPSLEP